MTGGVVRTVLPWMSMGGEESLRMDASLEEVWALVSDVTRIGEFSPETFEARWRRGSTGPGGRGQVQGAREAQRRRPDVLVGLPGHRVRAERAVRVRGRGGRADGRPVNRWGYRLAPDADGTVVTEYFQLGSALPMKAYWLVLGPLRSRTNHRGMRTTLERMKAVVEAGT